MVLGVIIDHGLCKDLIIFISFDITQMLVHESGDLIHVQIDVRNLSGFYIINFCQFAQDGIDKFRVVIIHISNQAFPLPAEISLLVIFGRENACITQ